MYLLLKKIVKTPVLVVPQEELLSQPRTVLEKRLETSVRNVFRGSLAIREVAAGSTNAEEQELVALANAYYDIDRFGIHFVASPRHADMLLVSGPVSRNMKEAVLRTYAATPDPKIVVAVGDGAINGGVYRDSYAVYNSLKDIIPVDFEIPGDPPSPRTVLVALLQILEILEKEEIPPSALDDTPSRVLNTDQV